MYPVSSWESAFILIAMLTRHRPRAGGCWKCCYDPGTERVVVYWGAYAPLGQ